jgi:hypothetical protein
LAPSYYVTGPTKLAARKLEIARTLNLEPDPGDRAAWHSILIEPEPRDVEGMDDVSGIEKDVNRLAERNYELRRGKIVLAAFVGHSKFVLVGDLSDIDRTELFMPMSRSVSDLSNRKRHRFSGGASPDLEYSDMSIFLRTSASSSGSALPGS